MKSLLDLVPEVGKILDNLISTPEEKREAELRLREIDIREVEARLGVQKEWLGNKSVFVAGAIPTILWMVSIVIAFNCIIAPLLSPVWKIPIMALPDWYAGLAGTIVLGLFGKKTIDGNEFRLHGEVIKPAKGREVDEQTEPEEIEPEIITPIAPAIAPKPVAKKAAAPAKKSAAAPAAPQTAAPEKDKYDTPEKVDTRLEALAKQYGAKQ